jgi:hypothetical protein
MASSLDIIEAILLMILIYVLSKYESFENFASRKSSGGKSSGRVSGGRTHGGRTYGGRTHGGYHRGYRYPNRYIINRPNYLGYYGSYYDYPVYNPWYWYDYINPLSWYNYYYTPLPPLVESTTDVQPVLDN